MQDAKLKCATIRNDNVRIKNPDILLGDSESGYNVGLLLDANATKELINTLLESNDLVDEQKIRDAIAAVIDSAPATLDTLNELAASLGDDANFAGTMTTALAGKQETLVSGTNIKTVNGESLLGEGDVTITTARPFKSSWHTNTTLALFCQDVVSDPNTLIGNTYLGELRCSGLPTGIANGEVQVDILGESNSNKIVLLTVTSTNLAPYHWEMTYFMGNMYGWRSFLLNGTTLDGVPDGSTRKLSDYLKDEDVFDTPDANGHDYVDLGLPSGTLWATMNVGATTAEGYGNYYAWGRTTPYNESDARYDGNEQLYDLTHDAASLVWGGDWHTPTESLILELIHHTKVTTIESGCYKYENLNDPTKYILIPRAGAYFTNLPASTTPSNAGTYAFLLSNINNLGDTSGTTAKIYCPTSTWMGVWPKVHGASVRPVLDGMKPKYVANTYLIQPNWSQNDTYAPDYILNKPTVTDSKLVTTTSVSDNTTYYPIVGANSSSASIKNIDSTGYKYNSVSGTTSAAGYSTVTLGNGTASGTAGSKRGQLALYDNGTHSNTLNSALLTDNRILSLPDEDGTLATQAYVAANGGSIDVIQVDGVPLTIDANKTVNITGKADKVVSATNGHLAGLDSNGNLTDSGRAAVDLVEFSSDSGVGIVPEDGIKAETVTAGATMSINPDVVTVVDGAVGTAAITLQVPSDNLAHVWDILMTTDSSVNITFATSNSATIKKPSGFSIAPSKSVEISVIGVGSTYYLRYGEFT